MGYPDWLVKIAAQVWLQLRNYSNFFEQHRFTCSMLHFEDSSYQECEKTNPSKKETKLLDRMIGKTIIKY